MAEQDKKATQVSENKDAAKKADDKGVARNKDKDGSKAPKKVKPAQEVKPVTIIDKYFAGAILFSIFITALSGFSAGVSFNEVFYRCMVISLSLWAVSIVIKKYCSLLANFKRILEEMKKDSAVVSPIPSEEHNSTE